MRSIRVSTERESQRAIHVVRHVVVGKGGVRAVRSSFCFVLGRDAFEETSWNDGKKGWKGSRLDDGSLIFPKASIPFRKVSLHDLREREVDVDPPSFRSRVDLPREPSDDVEGIHPNVSRFQHRSL